VEQNGAIIKVIGVGGGGSNAVNRMIEAEIRGVEFVAMNTDIQVLDRSSAPKKIQLGQNLTRGLGAGGDPEVGKAAADESKAEIRKVLEGSDMVFITAGMGGGTGTGAAPIVAEIARELGAVTVGIVTRPFRFEGNRRNRLATEGLEDLVGRVDTMISIPNDRLMDVAERRTALSDAFRMADDILRQGVQGISDIITIPGMINVDFADVKAVMQDAGPALMGIGLGVGDRRALQAAQEATSSPLLEQTINGARGLLVNITSGSDATLTEITEAMDFIHSLCDQENANIFFGTVVDDELEQDLRITVLATGFDPETAKMPAAGKDRLPEPIPTDPRDEAGGEVETEQPKPFRTGHRVSPQAIWDKAREQTDPDGAEPEQQETEVDVQDDIDIPAFLREHRRRQQSED
jgi:cell division protein FtsZ